MLLFLALTALQEEGQQSGPLARRNTPLSDCGDHISRCATHEGAAELQRTILEEATDS